MSADYSVTELVRAVFATLALFYALGRADKASNWPTQVGWVLVGLFVAIATAVGGAS